MPYQIEIYCEKCKKHQKQDIREDENAKLFLQCTHCRTQKAPSPDAKSFVLDGPPGSGKSTVLFGMSDGDQDGVSQHTMVRRGYHCIHESVAEAHEHLGKRGIDFSREKERWLRTILEIDLRKYFSLPAGISFFDRCFHHWRLLGRAGGIKLPDWYDDVNKNIRYDHPIFLCAPVRSMDLTDPRIIESRRFTWQQRLDMYEDAKSMYQHLGYDVIDVPMFHEDHIEKNNRARIELILQQLGLPARAS